MTHLHIKIGPRLKDTEIILYLSQLLRLLLVLTLWLQKADIC